MTAGRSCAETGDLYMILGGPGGKTEAWTSSPWQLRPPPKAFDSTCGYPGEGPTIVAKKQGAKAWENFEVGRGLRNGGTNRLIAHAVQDETLLKKYIPRVRAFLVWAVSRGTSEAGVYAKSAEDIDVLMADFLDEGFYARGESLDWAAGVVHGFAACFPEFDGRLPLAHRALVAWKRIQVPGEGSPIPFEAVFAIAEFFRDKGRDEKRPEFEDYALLTETAMDTYLRHGEWAQLRYEDVAIHDGTVSFMLGVSGEGRGERVKTGFNQGVVLDSLSLAREWTKKLARTPPGSCVFPFTPLTFYKEWFAALRALGLSEEWPPHALRHAGASRDVEMKTRTLEEVRRRGRWKTLDSVQRYTKTFALVRARAAMPKEILAKGTELAKHRGQREIHK